MLKLAFGAVLGAALVAPAAAQNFPDVPEYAWAYDAVLNLKREGILVGYPDGLFRGGRPASRYELAAAVNSAYEKLKGMIGGLQNQVQTLNQKIGDLERGMANKADKSELAALRDAISKLQADVDAMRGWGRAIDDLKKLTAMLQDELKEIRGDVDSMMADLDTMKGQIEELYKRKPAVDIHGDVNFVVHAGHGSDGMFGVTVDGRPTGVGRGAYSPFAVPPGGPVGMTRDLTMGHEAAFQMSGTNETGPQWHATLVVGNLVGFTVPGIPLFSAVYGNQSLVQNDVPFAEANESVYFQDFMVSLDTSVWGQNFSAELGRIGYKTGPYFFQRLDNTPYFNNPRWDDGNWYFDGGKLMFNWGAVTLDVWGGRNTSQFDSLFVNPWPMLAGEQIGNPFFGGGALVVDQSLGASLKFDLGGNGDVMLNYIFLDSNTPVPSFPSGTPYNRVNVWGGEVNYDITSNISINGGYSRTDMRYNTTSVNTSDNFAWWAQASYSATKWGLGVGYRHIEPWFGAPGDWGRIGFVWNPVDIKGGYGNLWFDASSNFKIALDGYYYQEVDAIFWSTSMKITGVKGNITYQVNPDWMFMLGAEWNNYDFGGGSETDMSWYRAGLDYTMDANSSLRFYYEFSNLNDKGAGSPFSGVFSTGAGADRRGGLLTIQWMRKF